MVFARGDDGRVTRLGLGGAPDPGAADGDPGLGGPPQPRPRPPRLGHPRRDRKMSDFNLTVAPVMDEHHRMIGVITVDDVLEMLLPTGWRRDFGMTAGEE